MFEFFAVIGIDDAIILGALGMTVGGASGFMSSLFGNSNSKKSAKLNYKYALRMAENGPSASVKGLRNAGLNPILAATDGSFSSPKMPSIEGAGTPDVSSSVLGAANFALNAKQTNSNVSLAKTQGDLNNATAFKAFADGLTKLKTGGMSGGYAALHSLGVRLGLGDKTTKELLKSYGFSPDVISAPDGSVKPSADVRSRNAPDDSHSSPTFGYTQSFDYVKNEIRRDFAKLPYDDRKRGYNALKEISPTAAFILKPLLKPSEYKMPSPPRSNATHNALRKFHREDKKRSYKNHSWKVK